MDTVKTAYSMLVKNDKLLCLCPLEGKHDGAVTGDHRYEVIFNLQLMTHCISIVKSSIPTHSYDAKINRKDETPHVQHVSNSKKNS